MMMMMCSDIQSADVRRESRRSQ